MQAREVDTADGARLVIRGGADDREVAAALAAVEAMRRDDAAPRERRTPPWLAAALREGLGGAPACEPSDLR